MKTPIRNLITRESLVATASYNTRWFARLIAGSAVLGTSALASNWDGDVSNDWNDNNNWAGNVANTGNAVVNVNSLTPPPFFPVISANSTQTMVDLFVGFGAGANGRLDHTAGTAATGGGNWMEVGNNGGTGVYNLADTAASGGTFTGFGTGSGNMNVNGRLYVGGSQAGGRDAAGGNGTVRVNTTGTLAINGDLNVGVRNNVGVVSIDAGTVTTNGWNFFGRESGIAGGNGTFNMSGGTLTNTNGNARAYVALGNATGSFNMSGGTYNNIGTTNDNQFAIGVNNLANATTPVLTMTGGTINARRLFTVGGTEAFGGNGGDTGPGKGSMVLNGATAVVNVNGEFWVGQGTASVGDLTISSGTINTQSWIAIGRGAGTGTVSMSGGTWNKTGTGAFIVGASGPGTYTHSGGLVDVQAGDTWMGENNTCNYTLSGTGEFRATIFQVARNGGSVGNVNLNGGTLLATRIIGGGGAENVSFNGTQIIARATDNNFISGMDIAGATINSGGLLIDSAGFTLVAPQVLGGSGGVVKSGAGTLTLSGINSYSGGNTVNGGKLGLNTDATGTGPLTLADGTAVGITQNIDTDSFDATNATFGTSAGTTLDINLGNIAGNPTAAPLAVGGTLTLNGDVTINVADQFPAVGSIPLVSYTGAKAGSGSFVLGTLPNGVIATLNDNGTGLVSLDVTSVSLPIWDGTIDDLWDTTTANWFDQVTSLQSTYSDPAPVKFDDSALGSTDVTLNVTVAPSSVAFNNASLPYTLTGTGKITGTTGLTKTGGGSLLISNTNDYTGVTTLSGGITTVATLTNGGQPSPLGAATAAPANLVLGGGTLEYTGGNVTIDRGITLTGNSGLITDSDLTLNGPILRPLAGGINKGGAGTLTLAAATNALGPVIVSNGNLAFDGTGGPQTNTSIGLRVHGGNGVTLPNGTTLNNTGDVNIGEVNSTPANFTLSGNSVFSTTNRVMTGVDLATASGNILVSGNSQFNMTGGWLSIGQVGGGSLTVKDSGSFYMAGSDFNFGDLANSSGSFILEDNGNVDINFAYFAKAAGSTATVTISGGTFTERAGIMAGGTADAATATAVATITQTGGAVNFNGDDNRIGASGTATWNISAGSINSNGWMTLGRYAGGTGTMNASGGTVTQSHPDRPFRVGEIGTGILNVSGTAVVSAANAGGYSLGGPLDSSGTINLDGGILVANRIYSGGADGNSKVSLDGGTLRAAPGANLNFISADVDEVVLDSNNGDSTIDTNGQTVAINRSISDGGGNLIKSGAGTLFLNAANGYLGTTTVTAGTLGGNGSLDGPLQIDATASINPGTAAGLFAAFDSVTINGSYVCELDGGVADQLIVGGQLTIGSGAVLNFSTLNAPTAPSYVIASFGSRSGPNFTVQNLPAGYQVVYSATEIRLEQVGGSAYDTWATSFGLNPLTNGAPTADPDGDGQPNSLEFALGGSPTSGSNNAKVYSLAADSDADGDSTKELILTIAVRAGTPAFTGSPSPTATHEGYTYSIQGSTNLTTFTSAAVPVTPVTTGLPAAPAGYVYRSFSLSGSNGMPGKGFLRVQVTP